MKCASKYLIPILLLLMLFGCNPKQPYIITVTGRIPASRMGTTLEHEHILVDFIGADSSGYHRWDKQEVLQKALPYLMEVKALGCQTLVECTPAYLGRDPLLMKMLSEESGLQILTNTGYYGARDNIFVPAKAFDMSAEALAAEWIAEFDDGIEGSGIRPGFIKMAVDRDSLLSPMHEKLIRAAGLAHLETGLVIKSHTGTDEPALNQIAVLEELGVSGEAFIWTHAQRGSMEGWRTAAGKGAWISLDNVRSSNISGHVTRLLAMKEAGLLDHMLISHDSGWYRVGEPDGGQYNGYTAIFKEFIPALRAEGFSQEDIDQLLVENPARAFSVSVRKI